MCILHCQNITILKTFLRFTNCVTTNNENIKTEVLSNKQSNTDSKFNENRRKTCFSYEPSRFRMSHHDYTLVPECNTYFFSYSESVPCDYNLDVFSYIPFVSGETRYMYTSVYYISENAGTRRLDLRIL